MMVYHLQFYFHNTLSALIEPIDTCTSAHPSQLQSIALDDHSPGEGQEKDQARPQIGSVDHTCLCNQPLLLGGLVFLYLISKMKSISGPFFPPK